MIEFSVGLWLRDIEVVREICQEAERLGFDGVFYGEGRGPECWTTIAALAIATRKIRLGPGITFLHYRHPVLLAKSVATLDVLSRGRIELRLGVGGAPGYGLTLPGLRDRVEQLREGLEIMKLLWTRGEATFRGKQFVVENATCEPSPVQKPHPPITIAAKGPRMISLAAEYADTVEGFYSPEEFKTRTAKWKTKNRPQLSLLANVCIARIDSEAKVRYDRYLSEREFSRQRQERLRERDIVGSPESCREKLQKYLDAGVTRFALIFIDAAELSPLRFFAEEVAPQFR